MVDKDKMKIKMVRTIDESYEIVFGIDLFPRIAQDLKDGLFDNANKYAIFADKIVAPMALKLADEITKKGLEYLIFHIPAGFHMPAREESKNVKEAERLWNELARNGFGRDSGTILLGGGVVGDLGGWVASQYCRGIPFIQIPTTMISQADSAVGGKLGVDLEAGKNLVGQIVQPKRVYIDVATLRTLPQRLFEVQLVETIKHGIIRDYEFFEFLEDNMGEILKRNEEFLLNIAKNNCRIKGEVVEIDPEERGLRRILNYGHTIGHAIETLSNYKLSHGESISMGMTAAGVIAMHVPESSFTWGEFLRQQTLLDRVGLPIRIPEIYTNENIIRSTCLDKKAKGGKARYCLPSRLGRMNEYDREYVTPVDKNIVIDALDASR